MYEQTFITICPLHSFIHSLNIDCFNLLSPTGYVMHQHVQHSKIVRSAQTVFICFVCIWEKTATCASYSIDWLVFIAEMKCLLRGTAWVF